MDPEKGKALQKLLDKSNLYEYTFRHHPDPIGVLDRNGDFLTANGSCSEQTGYPMEELLQLSFFSLLPVEEREQVAAHLQKAILGEQQEFSVTIRCKGECHAIWQVTFLPIDLQGEVMGVYAFAKDVTQCQREQERMYRIEQQYQLISEYVEDLISYSSPDGICHYVSPSIRTLLGYEPEEAIGRATIEFFHPDDQQKLMETPILDADVFTCRVRHRDGRYVWFETRFNAYRDENGEIQYYIGVGRDITERKKMEDRLLRRENSLTHAQRIAHIGHFDWDMEHDKLFWSDELFHLFGVEPSEFGENFESFTKVVHPDDLARIHEAMQWSIATGYVYEVEYRIVRPDGDVHFVESRGDAMFDDTGRARRFLGVVQDITERRKTEEMILQSEKLTLAGQLAAGIAHEIRNPLTALKGFLQLMMYNKRENEQHLSVMYSELNRIETILSELLVLAKPQAKQVEQHELEPMLLEVSTLINTQASMNNIELVLQVEPDLPQIACNQNELKQVFINFLKNSMEAMPHGGQMAITAMRESGQSIRIRFQDQGCGIPKERLARLGEPFYTTKEKGTGLGFMVSKKIIEAHQGRLHVSSELGVGTTIDVILPVKWEPLSTR